MVWYEETSITKLWHSKHVSVARVMHATVEELW
jgi:hypothetical protein